MIQIKFLKNYTFSVIGDDFNNKLDKHPIAHKMHSFAI